jgi:hypothetical protein
VLAVPKPAREYLSVDGQVLKVGYSLSFNAEKYLLRGGTIIKFEIIEGSDFSWAPSDYAFVHWS